MQDSLDVSTFLLRAICSLGLTSAAASLCLPAFYLARCWVGNAIHAGFMPRVLLILLFGDMTLLGIGLIGEHQIHIMREVR